MSVSEILSRVASGIATFHQLIYSRAHKLKMRTALLPCLGKSIAEVMSLLLQINNSKHGIVSMHLILHGRGIPILASLHHVAALQQFLERRITIKGSKAVSPQ